MSTISRMTGRLCCDRFVALESWLMVGGAICLAVSQTLAFSTNSAVAQITPDATLPNNSSVKLEGSTFNITGGTSAGSNLFHSFKEFSIPTGGTAFFNNAGDIQNIISRVTGGTISNIDGLIRTSGAANLFLINPNGIIFGANASLNIGGSFLASTASSLKFADGSQFSATASQTTPLLTISVPIGLQFGVNPGSILNQSQVRNSSGELVGLQVQPGKTLALVGGDVNLDSGGLTAPGGQVELGGVAGVGTVGLNVDNNLVNLSFPDAVARADVSVSNGSRIDVTAGGGGSITINARNLDILGESSLAAGIGEGLGTVGSVAGDITLNGTGAITIGQPSEIRMTSIKNKVGFDATGNGGDINIKAGSALVIDSAILSTTTIGHGDAGSISVQVDGNASFANTFIYSDAVERNAGSVLVQVNGNVSFANSEIASSTIEHGDAGSISVQANGNVSFANSIISNATLGTFETGSGIVGQGDAGSISVQANGNISFANSYIDSQNSGKGNAGSVLVQTNGNISFADSDISSYTFEQGNAGSVSLQTNGDISFANSYIGSYTSGQGDAGSVSLQANGGIYFGNSVINSKVFPGGEGKGGDIQIRARSLSLTNRAQVVANTNGQGDAGSVNINARDTVNLEDSFIANAVLLGAVGKAGDIRIETGTLSLTNGAQVNTGTLGQGDAGSVNINARDTVSIDGVDSNGNPSLVANSVEKEGMGNGGDINITAGSLSVTNGAQLNARTLGKGDAGSVNINARDTVSFDGVGGAFSSVQLGGVGNGGEINITAGSLSLTNGAELVASTWGQGDAGSVNINARDTVSFNGVGSNRDSSAALNSGAFSSVQPGGVGNGGDINITAGSLSVMNGAVLVAGTRGQGDAGNVNINAHDTVSFNGVGINGFSSGAFSTVGSAEAVGNGGDIKIIAGSLSVTNGAELFASTFGQGNSGSVNINVRDTVSFDGVGSNGLSSAALSGVASTAVGKGGDINITAESLFVTNGAFLTASTWGQGDGGNITLNANSLEATNGGQVLTTSHSSGKTGNITVNVTDSVTLAGSDRTYFERTAPSAQFGEDIVRRAGPTSGLFANTSENSTSQGGNLGITTRQLIVQDGAQVNVSSEGTGNAGSLKVEANSIKMDNGGKLLASTASGEGGNIDLLLRDLIKMRHQSLISAQADKNGNGGNITINAPFIVAVKSENSDIVANAKRGRGGNINITTSGIYGLEYRPQLTELSDINASSQFGVNGTVQINTSGIDPSQGLVNLPIEPVEPKVASGCTAGATQNQSRFVITGRGGLPLNPREAFNSDTVRVDWVTLKPSSDNRDRQTVTTTIPTPAPIVEATGWVMNAFGEVFLTANPPTATPHSSWQTPTTCGAPKSARQH